MVISLKDRTLSRTVHRSNLLNQATVLVVRHDFRPLMESTMALRNLIRPHQGLAMSNSLPNCLQPLTVSTSTRRGNTFDSLRQERSVHED